MAEGRLAASAIVLAGGRSARFGVQKLDVLVGGVPLLHRALASVAELCDEIVVVGPAGERPLDLPTDLDVDPLVVHDKDPYPGPLVALHRGAGAATRERLLLVAGDMPDMQPAILRRVLSWQAGDDGACLVFQGIDQPFPMGLDRAAVLARVPALIDREERSLRSLTASLYLERVREDEWRQLDADGRSLRDVDRPGDLDEVASPR